MSGRAADSHLMAAESISLPLTL